MSHNTKLALEANPLARASIEETRCRLLDAAEELFASRGFHDASTREITAMADTRLANVNDLFGSKESLFREVIVRRASQINADRMKILAGLRKTRRRQDAVKAVVEAFSLPMLVRSQESPGWCHFLRLLAQLMNTRSPILALVADQFSSISGVFVNRIGELIPELSERQRIVAYQLMLSSVMGIFADNMRLDIISGGMFRSPDFASHYADMVDFIVGGMLMMAKQ